MEGVDDIVIKIHDGIIRPLIGVSYVAGLAMNIISLSILKYGGFEFKFDVGSLRIVKGIEKHLHIEGIDFFCSLLMTT